jgi:hypothetical protein
MTNQSADEPVKALRNTDYATKKRALRWFETYIGIGNVAAYEALIDYYMGLEAAESLDDVHFRVDIVKVLSHNNTKKATVEAYVNELARTPSNNTTRKLYTEILRQLVYCSKEMVEVSLLELLGRKNYSYKIKNRILGVIDSFYDYC